MVEKNDPIHHACAPSKKHPRVGYAELASAVSNAGGLGIVRPSSIPSKCASNRY